MHADMELTPIFIPHAPVAVFTADNVLAALGTLDMNVINVRLVELDVIRAVIAHLLELSDGTDAVTLAAAALPYRQRCTPVTLT